MEREEIKGHIVCLKNFTDKDTFSGEHPNSYFLATAGANKADALFWL